MQFSELTIGLPQAEDILRIVEKFQGQLGPVQHRSGLRVKRSTENMLAGLTQHPPSTYPAQPQTQTVIVPSSHSHGHSTAAELLSTKTLPHFSTCSSSVDHLISFFDPHFGTRTDGHAREEVNDWKGRGGVLEGSIVPGMTLELSGPPGAGKTAIAVGIALSARSGRRVRHPDSVSDGVLNDNDVGEVLLIGQPG